MRHCRKVFALLILSWSQLTVGFQKFQFEKLSKFSPPLNDFTAKSLLIGTALSILLHPQLALSLEKPQNVKLIKSASILDRSVIQPSIETNIFAKESPLLLLSVEDADAITSRKVTLPSGVEYYDAILGQGDDIVREGSSVQFQWVLRRSNGYFVDSSNNYDKEPFIYKVGNTKKVIKGLDEAIRGMKVGGIRKISIPPSEAFVEGVGDNKPGPIPAGFGPRRQILTRLDREVWYFEIQLTKLKN